MKYLIGIFLFICIGSSVQASNCKGLAYTTLDNGDFVYSKVKARYVEKSYQNTYVKPRYVKFVFSDERKSRWVAYRYHDKKELMQWGGFFEPASKIDYANLKFDQSTITLLRDRAVVGFNLLCRLN